MTPLEGIIRAEIHASGPMRFDRFMELALYHPGLGYYAKPGGPVPIGRSGDFFTSVSVGPLFGRLLARQFFQMWQRLGNPSLFWIMEQGAHDGRFAADVLEWCRAEAPDFFEALRYAIVQSTGIESLPPACLADPDFISRITWFENLDSLSSANPTGVFFSNELVDAFPVRAIGYRAGQWRERCVELAGDAFAWTDHPLSDPELVHAIATRRPPLVEGYTSEINLHAERWMREVARVLRRGYVVTLDYGFPAHEYYAPHRPAGTLTAYAAHRRVDDILAEPGSQDITAHVDFTALARAGKDTDLETIGFTDQQHFIMGIAHDELAGAPTPKVGIAENLRAWNTLTHPEFLGRRFFALVQAKNACAELDGLRFARDGWDA